jgi:hypothetical protein
MPTGKGRTKDKTEIITIHGCRIPFKNNLRPGTKIRIFYNDNLDVVKVEPYTDKYSPENNPKIRYEDDVGNGE